MFFSVPEESVSLQLVPVLTLCQITTVCTGAVYVFLWPEESVTLHTVFTTCKIGSAQLSLPNYNSSCTIRCKKFDFFERKIDFFLGKSHMVSDFDVRDVT